jgi:hypothetical protein
MEMSEGFIITPLKKKEFIDLTMINDPSQKVLNMEKDLEKCASFQLKNPEPKCEVTSAKYRAVGNKHFHKKRFVDALKSYNKSLCYSQEGHVNSALAYASKHN